MTQPPFAAPMTSLLRLRKSGRVLATVWLLVHALIIGALPVLDARMDTGSKAVAHWEDASRTNCPPVHDASACQICQVLSNGADGPAPRVYIASAEESRLRAPRSERERVPGASDRAAHSPRAPPAV